MNIFIIPSWYPSSDNPYTGLFFKKEAELYARNFPKDNVGISNWGQNDESMLLYFKKPFSSFLKRVSSQKKGTEHHLLENCIEYRTPAFTWTRKIMHGNMRGLLSANESNLLRYRSRFGPPDILHAHVAFPGGYIAFLLSKKYRIPYVITEHQSPFPFQTFTNKYNTLIKPVDIAYKNSAENFAVSQNMKRMMKTFGVSKVSVLPNFIDENAFIPKMEVPKENDLLFVGRLEYQKAPDILVKAISGIESFNLKIKIIGNGSMMKQLRDQMYKLKRHDIQFLGAMNQKAIISEMQRSKALILPSRHEGLPFVIIEALACGLPVITTNCGGPEEMINDSVGIVVEKENEIALRQAIDRLLKMKKSYPIKEIREHFLRNYSSKEVTQNLRKRYASILANLGS